MRPTLIPMLNPPLSLFRDTHATGSPTSLGLLKRPNAVFQAIDRRLKSNDGDGELREMLLKRIGSVNCHKHIELCGTEPEQLSILDTSPASLRNRRHLIAFNLFGQSIIDALVRESEGPCRILKLGVSEVAAGEANAYSVRCVESPSDARTKLATFSGT